MDLKRPFNQPICAFKDCKNLATGKCDGSHNCMCGGEEYEFHNNCGEYFCTDHLQWGWGWPCVNCCAAQKQCPEHHSGIKCVIL